MKRMVSLSFKSRSLPVIVYFVASATILGFLAYLANSFMFMEGPQRDIWQHAAALRALIANLDNPVNPYVTTHEGSRHFQPVWVIFALIARIYNLTEWEVLALSAYLSMAVLTLGIFVFAKAYHPSPWAPLVVLLTMMCSWFFPILHTGFHSPITLAHGAALPATLMVGLSLLLWGLIIRNHENPYYAILLLPMSAFMFATHQLGAVIGFVGAGCFALLWQGARLKYGVMAISALLAGVALSSLWPYHNPLQLVLKPGNSSWGDGPDYYGVRFWFSALFPSVLGVLGLNLARGRPLLVALFIYSVFYLMGLTGLKIAGRFLMPITLVLQIGLASFLLQVFSTPGHEERPKKWAFGFIALLALFMHGATLFKYGLVGLQTPANGGSVYAAANELTRDIPDFEQVAAHDVAAWPVVSLGQRVVSVPWPEPGINDLNLRQSLTDQLFDPGLTKQERLSLARHIGVNTLLADRRLLSGDAIGVLQAQAPKTYRSGSMVRFDLLERQ